AYAFRLPRDMIERSAQRVDEFSRRAERVALTVLTARRAELERCTTALRLSDPRSIMARGYAAISLLPGLEPLRSVQDVEAGGEVRVSLVDGRLDCTVTSTAGADGRKT
ncbi:hypothetical protein K8S17_06140, partial [bacterium]|nr:hypothetical protein [bacterium]